MKQGCAGENWAGLVKIWRSGSPTTRSGNLTRIVSVSKSEILHSKLTRYRYKHSSKQNIKIEKMEIEREMYSGWNSGQIELGSTMLAFAPQSTYPSTWELILTTPHNANTKTNAENKRTFFCPYFTPPPENYMILLQIGKQMFMQILNVQSTVSDRSENLLLHGGTPSVTLTQML